jgi:hypothetical protein
LDEEAKTEPWYKQNEHRACNFCYSSDVTQSYSFDMTKCALTKRYLRLDPTPIFFFSARKLGVG